LLTRLSGITLAALAVLGFFGYTEIERRVSVTAGEEVKRVVGSSDALIKKTVSEAVTTATSKALPEYQAALRVAQRRHETELGKTVKEAQDEMQATTRAAKQQVKEAATQTVAQFSTTTTTVSLGSALPYAPSVDDLLKRDPAGFYTVSSTDSARTLEWMRKNAPSPILTPSCLYDLTLCPTGPLPTSLRSTDLPDNSQSLFGSTKAQ
jgi:hypothetical protein